MWVARPGRDDEYDRPRRWQKLAAGEDNKERLNKWQSGDAVGANMGGTVAVVDVDPQNDGDVEKVRQLLVALNVRVFAEIATPGGGRHFYVAGHPDLPNVTGTLEGFPGVDIQSFGKNVFLPGTERRKYFGAGYTVISDDLDALGDGGDPDGAEALADWVAQHHQRQDNPGPTAPLWNGTPPTRRERAYLEKTLSRTAAEIAAMPHASGRNSALYTAGLKLGSFVAGAGMDETEVIAGLTSAAQQCGLVDEDGTASVLASIRSGLRNGKCNPRQVPPDVIQLVRPAIDEKTFWTSRPELTHIRDFARSRILSPWAVLGIVMCRVINKIPPGWVLESTVGVASLNLYIATVGPAGAGKSIAVDAAEKAIDLGEITTMSVGTGEGVLHAFVHRDRARR
jgi:hypothetical protein